MDKIVNEDNLYSTFQKTSKEEKLNRTGNYRVYSVFEFNGEKIESFEEFTVGRFPRVEETE